MLDRRRFSIAAAAATALGVRPARAAVDFLRVNDAVALGSRTGGSGTIWFGGEAIAAWGDQHTRYALESSTKTIGALLLGVAIKRKGMALETLARAYLPTLGNPPAENKATGWPEQITIRHLAQHTAGFGKKGGSIIAVPIRERLELQRLRGELARQCTYRPLRHRPADGPAQPTAAADRRRRRCILAPQPLPAAADQRHRQSRVRQRYHGQRGRAGPRSVRCCWTAAAA